MKLIREIFFITILFTGTTIFLLQSGCKNTQTTGVQLANDSIVKNLQGEGNTLTFSFIAGRAHNHPTFAIWLETMEGEFIQTLFVTKALASGFFNYGEISDNEWDRKAGIATRPAALPYWLHKKGEINSSGQILPTPENPIADVYSGATPPESFVLKVKSEKMLPQKFRVLVEINQSWDWNEYWTNSRYPDNAEYKTSCQPAVVYAVTVELNSSIKEFFLNPIGHSHYAGENGNLFTDLSTLTSALQIMKSMKVSVE